MASCKAEGEKQMAKKVLILNDREPLPENRLDNIDIGLDVTWYQVPTHSFRVLDGFAKQPNAEILVATSMNLNAANLAQLPHLEAIIATTTGVQYIDLAYCSQKGIRVFNTPNYSTISVAEHAFALLLSAARKIPFINQAVHKGDFDCFEHQGLEMAGKTAGIIGFGNIGQYVAKLALGFNMNVLYVNRTQKEVKNTTQVDLGTLLAQSDVIFLTLPLNAASRGMLGKEEFSQMKKNAILISISPDAIIQDDALIEALHNKQIRAAALDIHHEKRTYLKLPNLILSPRRAWYTAEAFDRRIASWKKTLLAYLRQ